ncbi:hypothetical protein BH09PSE5_BH09PSE5_12900 [soil metagenome]
MRIRTILVIVVLLLVALFAALNWSAFLTVTTLNFLFASVEAPLGLVMLGLLGLVVLAFAIYMAVWQGSVLLETRRYSKELQTQRTLADQAEASRFTELRAYLGTEIARLHDRLAQTEAAMHNDVQASGNTIAAYIGEVEDRLERKV